MCCNIFAYFFFINKSENFSIIKEKVKEILSLNFKYDNNFRRKIYMQQKKIENFIQSIE